MVRRPYSGRNQPDTLMCAYTSCDNVSSALHLVEARILKSLSEWLSDYRLQWEHSREKENLPSAAALKEKALKRLSSEYDTLSKQLDSAHDLLEQGIYTAEDFLNRSRKLSERIKKNEADRAALTADIAADKQRKQAQEQIIPKIEKLLDVYGSLPSAKAKNDMLKETLERVVYLKTEKSRKTTPAVDFEITLYPRIPKN